MVVWVEWPWVYVFEGVDWVMVVGFLVEGLGALWCSGVLLLIFDFYF